ncbi:BMP family ABC transporter substrate-binding protein [Aquihabitans sp. McL0605]|uniref:BMP family ABC transporter substrate-binding protein n=1 Tax=Aquihabitans sp. McL0605 TaxID=3415671 RepID=UPI003CED59BB
MSRTSSRSLKLLSLALVAALTLVAAGCGGDDDASSSTTTAAKGGSGDPVKAAWVLVGPANDGGWSQAHNEGRLYVEKQLGDKVITTYKENVPEGPEAKQVMEDLVKDGNKIIFATSFGYGDALAELAKEHPDVKFEHATGAATADNLATYYGGSEDTIYLTGIAAGKAIPQGGKVGFVAPFAIPEVIRHINAFELGVQSVNPDATTQVVWTNTWFDPETERKAADSLISDGVEAIASGQDSPASGEAAKAKGLPFVGYDSDQSKNLSPSWLTASIYHWGPYYTKRIQAVADGTWKTGSYYGGIDDGFVSLAPFGPNVADETKALIKKQSAAIADGSFEVFGGPIKDQAGKVTIPKGSTASLPDLLSMDWFVLGVVGDPTPS